MIDTIISIIANIFSIFGVTIDPKEILNRLKNRKFRSICIAVLLCVCCIIVICFSIYKQKSITVTKVVLSEDSLTLNTNDTYVLTATALYSNNSTNNDVLWSSSNNSIAIVDQNGLVTALTDGSATIIAQASKNNTTEIAECEIIIKSPPSGYSISVQQTQIDSRTYFINVIPYEDDITKIQIYSKSPSGEIFTPYKIEDNIYSFYCGIWTIYASVENSAGIYEASKPEDFVTIEVTPYAPAQSYIKDRNMLQ